MFPHIHSQTDPDATLSDQPPLSPTSAVPPLQLQGGEQNAAAVATGGVVPSQPLHTIPLQQVITYQESNGPGNTGH